MNVHAAVVVLVLDDDPRVLSALRRNDWGAQFAMRFCSTAAEARAIIAHEEIEVALVDQHLAAGDPSGLEVLDWVRDRDPDCFRIIFTGAADLTFAVDAINRSRVDAFLLKPWTQESMGALLNQGCETTLLRRHNRQLAAELTERNADLERLNHQLESLVEERTRDLRSTLDRLRAQQDELIHLETQASLVQMVRGLAHELNNPLASILGFSQRLQRMFEDRPEVRSKLDIILQEVGRCCSVVDQLRGFAQPLAEGLMPCRPEDALRQAAQRLVSTGRRVPEWRVQGDIPRVLAAPRSLTRVFELVLDNARLAGADVCLLSASTRHGRIRLALANDGETPEEQTVRDAVRPFFTTRAHLGHRGLGLALAASLLREQSGQIELSLREDGQPGATCTITLPLPDPDSDQESATIRVDTPDDAVVLVVDDEPLIAELLVDTVVEAKLNAVRAASLAEAQDIAQRRPLRAVLADCHLPDGDGATLVAGLLQRFPHLRGHAALVTGSSDPENMAALSASTGLPILGKPFHLDDIRKLVRSIA
jgi:two-component system NtrC family sensor kinase